MRKLLVAVAALTMAVSAMANTGWMDSFAFMWYSTPPGDVYYDLNGATENPDFHGAYLGVFQQNGDLYLNGQINAWADGGDTYNYMSLYWRLGTSGGYTEQQDNVLDHMGGNDWRGITPGVNLLTGLTPGTYTVQVYAERSHIWGGGGPYITRVDVDGDTGGGAVDNPFAATFNVIPEPTTLALVGLGIAGLLAYRRRR